MTFRNAAPKCYRILFPFVITLMVVALLMPGAVVAAPIPAEEEAAPGETRPLSSLLDEAGYLDLNRDYAGILEPGGWQLVSGPGEAPRFAPGDDRWDQSLTLEGVDGDVYALAADDSHLYVGGDFTQAGGVSANNVAMWDGSQWWGLGSGVNAHVNALAVGKNGELFAGGAFTQAGGKAASYVARWDSISGWSALGNGVNGDVHSLAVDRNAADGRLYVGGDFSHAGGNPISNIAKWDGFSWTPLGTGTNGCVYAIIVTFFGGDVFAGGLFTTAGGKTVNHVARFQSGVGWWSVGDPANWGTNGTVYALLFDVISSQLYVGGAFTQAGNVPVNYVTAWDGVQWSPMQGGTNHWVLALGFDSFGGVAAGGLFDKAGSGNASGTASWDGSQWSQLGGGTNDTVHALTTDWDGVLYAGGVFITDGAGYPMSRVARLGPGLFGIWWFPVANGPNSGTLALVADNGQLYTGGDSYDYPYSGEQSWVRRWDGSQWVVISSPLNGTVKDMAMDGNGNLYVGGWFTTQGGLGAKRLLKWDGLTWWALGMGTDDSVEALAVDSKNNLYAGGFFSTAGGKAAPGVAMWDGTDWSALGSGTAGSVHALAVDGNDHLYAGGVFSSIGGVAANNIARWNGTGWSALGAGTDDTVFALAIDSNDVLYAGGDFTQAGGKAARGVASYKAGSWSALGQGVLRTVGTLAVDSQNNLYVGGYVFEAGGQTVGGIAKWDGSQWSALGSGLNNLTWSLAVDGDDNLYVGGWFDEAGGEPAYQVARWLAQRDCYLPIVIRQ